MNSKKLAESLMKKQSNPSWSKEPKNVRKTIYINEDVDRMISELARVNEVTQVQFMKWIHSWFKDDIKAIKTDFPLSIDRKPKTKLMTEGLLELMNLVADELGVKKEDALEYMVKTMMAEFDGYKNRTSLALESIQECHGHILKMIEKTDELFDDATEWEIPDRLYTIQQAIEHLIRDIQEFLNGGAKVSEEDKDL